MAVTRATTGAETVFWGIHLTDVQVHGVRFDVEAVGRNALPAIHGRLSRLVRFDVDCLDYLGWLRWPDGFVCPRCDKAGGWAMSDGRFCCAVCEARTSVMAGTTFDRTRTPLTVWFSRLLALRDQQRRHLSAESTKDV
jgi:hypothetical protein